jgi:hypothetical protein
VDQRLIVPRFVCSTYKMAAASEGQMSKDKSEGIGEQHLLLFGAIVRSFAAHESLIQRIMAHILATQAGSIVLLTRFLTFEEKRKALLDLLRHHKVPLDQYDHVSTYLNVPLTFTRLRDDIVHSVWVAALPPNSIQPDWILKPVPRIRPAFVEAESSRGDYYGGEAEKLAYSFEELSEIAATLQSNLIGFSTYAAEAGLVDKV